MSFLSRLFTPSASCACKKVHRNWTFKNQRSKRSKASKPSKASKRSKASKKQHGGWYRSSSSSTGKRQRSTGTSLTRKRRF